MHTCQLCGTSFSNRVVIDGVEKNLQHRKFCLDCSPFGAHNTRKLKPGSNKPVLAKLGVGERRCFKCGETRVEMFSPRRRRECRKCHSQAGLERGRDQKQKARDVLGRKCAICGYDKYQVSLDIHHKNPNNKDPNYATMRGWSWERIVEELEDCVLLCRNCHGAYHAGLVSIPTPPSRPFCQSLPNSFRCA